MNKITDYIRVKRIICEVIEKLRLDLRGMTVLTELASGHFVVTPMIAALAGAKKVYVVAKNSRYGSVDELTDYLSEACTALGTGDCIELTDDPFEIAGQVQIVTNLGFVRPITRPLLELLPYDAAVPLMFEAWEKRESDIDFSAADQLNIPVLGTNERASDLQIFKYVGVLAEKLLLEVGIEVFRSRIIVMSSGHFLDEISNRLALSGADVTRYNPHIEFMTPCKRSQFSQADAIVIAEQTSKELLVDYDSRHIDAETLGAISAKIIHISGLLNYELMERCKIEKHPKGSVDYGYMTVTTDYVGVRPVIELHCGGLKVGQAIVDGKRAKLKGNRLLEYAVNNSPAMPL